MVVSYVIGAILIAFGLAVIYESYSGTLTTIRIYYYPAIGTGTDNHWGRSLLCRLYVG